MSQSNLRFVPDNVLVGGSAAVISGTAVSTLPASNALLYDRGKYCRILTTGSSSDVATIRFTLASLSTISSVLLGPTNTDATTSVTITLRDVSLNVLYTSTKTEVAPIVPFGTLVWGIDPLGSVFTNKFTIPFWLDTPVNAVKYIDISFTGSAVTHYNLAYAFAGVYIETDRDPSSGLDLTYSDTFGTYRTEDGSLRTTSGVSFRRYSFSLSYMSESDRLTLLRFISKRKPFIISVFQQDPSNTVSVHQESDYTALVKSTTSFSAVSPVYGMYNTTITVEEV